MYNVPFPVSVIRTRIREEFERNRFVNKLPIVDVLLFKSDAEYQVIWHQCWRSENGGNGDNRADRQQETMNFWKQSNHVMSYFKEENFRGDHRLPSSFMSGFLEVRCTLNYLLQRRTYADSLLGPQLKTGYQEKMPCRYQIEFPDPPSETFLFKCAISTCTPLTPTHAYVQKLSK